MKKPFNTAPFYVLLAMMAIATTFSGCKDDDKDEPQLPKSYRMKTVEMTDDGDTYLNEFKYNADNKIERLSEVENGVEVYRWEWDWNGNVATLSEKYLSQGTWITEKSQEVLTYSAGHLAQSEYFVEDTLVGKTIYTWNGNLLTNESNEYYNADTVAWEYSITYIYEGAKLVRADFYTLGLLAQKQVIEYDGNKPVGLKTYDYMNVLEESSQMVYTGDKITTVKSFHVEQGVQGDIDCTETRQYDANNCMNNISTTCSGDYTYSSVVTWEEGTSNFNDFLITQVSWISAYLFPDTFPSELAYKKKK